MDTIKWTIEAIRVRLGCTRPEMAERMGITVDRYNRLASGESRMFATELIRLHNISNVPYDQIDPEP